MNDFQAWVSGNVATPVRHRVAASGTHVADFRLASSTLTLNSTGGDLKIEHKFGQGTIGVSGNVSLSVVDATTVRGDVSGATLDLDLDQGRFSCDHLMNFSFTLTEVR